MESDFLLRRTAFWSFCANVLFIAGMTGYLLIDLLDYVHLKPASLSITNSIYVLLASVFVINATLHLCMMLHTEKYVKGYCTMLVACIFDKLGSYAYLLGALLTATISTSTNTIWTLNAVGVCAFVIAATMNITVSGTSHTSLWADNLNLLGSLLYLLAIVVTRMPLSQIIVIFGDILYLICSILYMMCWCDERKSMPMMPDEQYLLFR